MVLLSCAARASFMMRSRLASARNLPHNLPPRCPRPSSSTTQAHPDLPVFRQCDA